METRIQLRDSGDAHNVAVSDFTWTRFKPGFQIEIGPSKLIPDAQDQFLVFVKDPRASMETFRPFAEPDLMLDFAKIRTAEGVLNFANRFGKLGFDNESWRLQNPNLRGNERVGEWLSEAAELRHVLQVWRQVEAEDTASLRKFIRWEQEAVFADLDKGNKLLIANWHENPRWLPRLKRGETLAPAKLYLAFRINLKLKGAADVGVRLDSDLKFRPISRPINLLSALWMLLSETVTGVRKIRPCEICGELMDVTANRSHKQVHSRCSQRERVRKYRSKSK